MNNRLRIAKNSLSVPWVLSGSMAMKLYGNKYGIPTRMPANVNIVVNRNKMANAYANLFALVPRQIPRNTSTIKNKNHYNLHPYDLLKANSELAPSINTYVELNGIPVVTLEHLLKYKMRALHNFPQENRKKQINANIQILRILLNKSKLATPLKMKRKTNRGTTVKTSRKHSNNFSTPPSSPPTAIRKRLAF